MKRWGDTGEGKGNAGCRKDAGRGMQDAGCGRRSPEEPPQEGVRALDPLLGLRHQLHGLPLLAGAVHGSPCLPFLPSLSFLLLLRRGTGSAAGRGARRMREMRDPVVPGGGIPAGACACC